MAIGMFTRLAAAAAAVSVLVPAQAQSPADFYKGRNVELYIGYSDDVSVFLNGKILFRGRSAQNFRDPGFLGIVNPEDDAVYLPLQNLAETNLLLPGSVARYLAFVEFGPTVDVSTEVNRLGPRIEHAGLEYDTVSGRFAEFVQMEVIPRVIMEVQSQLKIALTLTDARMSANKATGAVSSLSFSIAAPMLSPLRPLDADSLSFRTRSSASSRCMPLV